MKKIASIIKSISNHSQIIGTILGIFFTTCVLTVIIAGGITIVTKDKIADAVTTITLYISFLPAFMLIGGGFVTYLSFNTWERSTKSYSAWQKLAAVILLGLVIIVSSQISGAVLFIDLDKRYLPEYQNFMNFVRVLSFLGYSFLFFIIGKVSKNFATKYLNYQTN